MYNYCYPNMIILIEEKNPRMYAGQVVIVDASVVVDFILENSLRHNDAISLIRFLMQRQIRIRIPFHGAFEVQSAIRRSVWFERGRQAAHARKNREDLIFQLFAVPIDHVFLDLYTTRGLPHLKSGDLPYLAMAKADKVPLITEDQELYDKAHEAGVAVFKISEYFLS
jgi:predicted nucleic acid-binding protein